MNMSEFVTQIKASIDLSEAKSQLDSFMNENRKIKVDVDTGAISKMQSQIDTAFKGNFKIKPNVDISSARSVTASLTKDFQRVQSLAKQISSTKIKIAGLDSSKNANEISVLSNQVKQMEADYKSLLNTLGQSFNVDQKGKLESIFGNMDDKIEQITAKAKDMSIALKESQSVSKLDATAASNKTLTWLNNNTKAAKDYGQALTDLAQKQKNAQTNGELKSLNKEFKEITSTAALAGKTGNSWTTEFSKSFGQIGQFVGMYVGIQQGVQVAKQMVTEVISIDTAMTNLKKVTDETASSYSKFLSNSGQTAKSLGADVSSYITQVSEWAKLGYGLSASENLGKTSMIYSNVGEVDDSTAVSDLVTTMKAFNLEADDSLQIVDRLNSLSNKYAVSAAGLGEGLKNSASALAMQGNSMDQVIAMLTGGGEITQSPGELGNALKVVSLRLASMKGSLSEIGEEYEDINSVSKNQTEIYNMTKGQVNILDEQNGKLKDTYTILEEVAGAWDSVNDLQKSELAELMFGKNRANQGIAVLQAFQSGQIQKALTDAQNSEGSAQAEQDKIMNSLEAKINTFKAAFQELSSATLNSDFLKGAIDAGTALLEVLTQIISVGGGIPAIFGGVGIASFVKSMAYPKIIGVHLLFLSGATAYQGNDKMLA